MITGNKEMRPQGLPRLCEAERADWISRIHASALHASPAPRRAQSQRPLPQKRWTHVPRAFWEGGKDTQCSSVAAADPISALCFAEGNAKTEFLLNNVFSKQY